MIAKKITDTMLIKIGHTIIANLNVTLMKMLVCGDGSSKYAVTTVKLIIYGNCGFIGAVVNGRCCRGNIRVIMDHLAGKTEDLPTLQNDKAKWEMISINQINFLANSKNIS